MTSIKRASLWSIANGLSTRGLSFIFFVFLSRTLSPSIIGLMALAVSITFIVDTLVDFGLTDAIVREKGLSPDFLNAAATYQISLSVLILMIFTACATLISQHFSSPDLVYVVPLVLIASVFTAVGLVPLALLKKNLDFKSIAKRNFIGTCFGGIIGILLAVLGCGIWSLVALHVINALTCTIICCYTVRWFPRLNFRYKELITVKNFVMNLTMTRVLENSISRVDQFVVGSFFGAVSLGLYSLGVKLYDVLFQVICGSFSDVFYSKLSAVGKDRVIFKESFLRFLRFASLVGPSIFTSAALFFGLFVIEIFGPQWKDAEYFIVLILGFASFQSIAYVNSVALVALGFPNLRLRLALTSISLWIVAVVFLVKLGPLMAAVAWAGRVSVVLPLQVYFIVKNSDVTLKEYLARIVHGLVAASFAIVTYFIVKYIGIVDFKYSAMIFASTLVVMVFTLVVLTDEAKLFATKLTAFLKLGSRF